jgi:hypothetical protein
VFNVTIGLAIWCSEAMTLALVAFIAWRHNVRDKTYLYWGIGFLLSGIGLCHGRARGHIPSILSIESATPSRLRDRVPGLPDIWRWTSASVEWWVLLPPAIWLAGVFLPWVNDDYPNRVALYNLASAAGATALTMAVSSPGLNREAARAKLAIIFIVQSCLCFATALAIGIISPMTSRPRTLPALRRWERRSC